MVSFIAGYCPGSIKPLFQDLQILKQLNVKTILCLMTHDELKKYSMSEYPKMAQKYGFIFYHVPVSHYKSINASLLHSVHTFLNYKQNQQGNVYLHSWKHRRAEQLNAFLQKRSSRHSFLTSSSFSSN